VTDPTTTTLDAVAPRDFLRQIIADDLAEGRHASVITRFPPEPNGYLHIGHAKSITLNFGVAREFGGRCHLRFDDTNPETEDQHYVDSIIDTVRWLGYDPGPHIYFASDYFERMYTCAEHLIRIGKAYVDGATEEEVREARGTVTRPGRPTPDRGRSVEENLDLFRRMRAGDFPDGAYVLRAKIDLGSPNMLMRDPVLYRIRHASHYRTGDDWCIYPLYDYAHPLEDAFEHVTHSFCTLEFENNRELYDWVVENCPVPARPHQYEFARLALDYTVMSKRILLQLVNGGLVTGWDDPRMPTIAGLRRRGVTAEAIRAFCEMIGVAKTNSRLDIAKLEYTIRDDLNTRAPRVMCVTDPLRVVITNWPAGTSDVFDAPYWPHDVPNEGSRPLPFSGELFIEREDFAEDPPSGFHRLAPGREVRLRYAYIIRCDEVVKDASGKVIELRCTYDPGTRGGAAPDDRAVKGTLHWVSIAHALPCQVRLYDRLFRVPDARAAAEESGSDFTAFLNPASLVVCADAHIEPSVAQDVAGTRYQFERLGYFVSDTTDSRAGALVFNRTVTLRDTWAKVSGAQDFGRPQRKSQEPRSEPPARAAVVPPRSGALAMRMKTIISAHNLEEVDADLLTRDAATADLFDATVRAGAPAQSAANWIIHELTRELQGRSVNALQFGPAELARLIALVESGRVNSSTARDVLSVMAQSGGDPAAIVERQGLSQISDDASLTPIIDEVLANHDDRVAAYRAGRTGLLGFFVGQVMGRTAGRANPERVKALLTERLGG
jgi:glutaminyl-tRNA synthetase